MPSETPNRDAVRIDLSGDWLLAAADNSHALTIALPGDVHSALQRAGIIADPYRGRNEADVQWVARKDWVLERTVVIDADDLNGGWYLDFESMTRSPRSTSTMNSIAGRELLPPLSA